MNLKDLVHTTFNMWKKGRKEEKPTRTLVILGAPGIGKTASGRMLATLMTDHMRRQDPDAKEAACHVLDLSSMLPEDLMGLPFRDGNVTRYCPQSWMAPLCEPGAYGVLILDDLPAAAAQVQVACRQVSLERRIHEMKLADGVFVMVTGNRREDRSAATTLPAHFRNSVLLLPFQPDFPSWVEWYHDQNLDSDIPAFLEWKKGHFSHLPKDADEQGAFATPRTWAMLGEMIGGVEEKHVPEIASGLVGSGVSAEFAAFRLLRRELVSPEKVLEDPERAIPNLEVIKGPDKMVAICTGLGEVAARLAKGPKTRPILTKYLQALSYVTTKDREFIAVSISTFTACKGTMKDVVDAARASNGDPKIKAMITFLAKTLES